MWTRFTLAVAGLAVALTPALFAQDQEAPGGRRNVGQTTGGLGVARVGPGGPPPRNAAGRVLLGGATPEEKGVWLPGPGGLARLEDVPMQPWARALRADRELHQLEPHARCKASGVARQFLTPYGVEFVELPELQQIYIFDIGGPHTYRTIYMDGRTHPAVLTPSFYGHSIGWWEGDTLVVSTTGFNEHFWFDRGGLPHTETLRTLERFTRVDSRNVQYELTVDDPAAYTAPWKGKLTLVWEAGTELFEYQCQQQNYADNLMLGQHKSVDRTTLTVP